MGCSSMQRIPLLTAVIFGLVQQLYAGEPVSSPAQCQQCSDRTSRGLLVQSTTCRTVSRVGPATYSITDEFVEPAENIGGACDHHPKAAVIVPSNRAGHPETISPFAVSSNRCHYDGYFVGGGLPLLGECRCVQHEGTWGWDYFGILFPKRVALGWAHGWRAQGGSGAYKTDGPKLRPE